MTPASDRRHIISLIDEATAAGARLEAACAALGVTPRTLQRWKDPTNSIREDRRPSAERPAPANKLTAEERDQIVAVCNAAEFASRSSLRPVPQTGRPGCA